MTLYSIGHSNSLISAFLNLIGRYDIAVLVDIRSKPFSRYNPHFSRDALKQSLNENGIEYVFMGNQLGGRPEAEEYYFDTGRVDYEHLSEAPFYLAGIERLIDLGEKRRVAFMCSEADYKKCHRYWLITRTLCERGVEVQHILHSGELIKSEAAEFEPEQPSLF